MCLVCVGLLFAAVTGHAAKAPVATKPMTQEEFEAKRKDYMADKITNKNFIALCDKVLKDAEAAGSKDFTARVLNVRAYARIDAKDAKGAYADADKIIEIDPDNPLGYIVRLRVLEVLDREGKTDEAVGYIKKIAERTSDAEDKKQILQYAEDYPLLKKAIAPKALWKAFDENEVAAEDAYKGKVISVKGKIHAITTSVTGYPQITFAVDPYGVNSVHCELPKEARPEIAKLKKGKEVIIAGKCTGMTMKSVFLRDCRILE